MKYKQISKEQRYQISALIKTGSTMTEIAKILEVDKSTISREIKRNSNKRGRYIETQAQEICDIRKERFRKKRIFTEEKKRIIEEKLKKYQWSPEQIRGYCIKNGIEMVSIETIYKYIRTDIELRKYLRHNKPYKKKYGMKDKRKEPLKDRKFINERPKEVEEKKRVGDWEVDLIEGMERKEYLVVLTERKTQYLLMEKIENKTSELVGNAIIKMLDFVPRKLIKTITSDNGKEFQCHKEIERKLKTHFYFTNPYCSYEKGLVEYQNKLIRQYVPKKTDLRCITNDKIKEIENKLNSRPRKKLNYDSPNKIFFNTFA